MIPLGRNGASIGSLHITTNTNKRGQKAHGECPPAMTLRCLSQYSKQVITQKKQKECSKCLKFTESRSHFLSLIAQFLQGAIPEDIGGMCDTSPRSREDMCLAFQSYWHLTRREDLSKGNATIQREAISKKNFNSSKRRLPQKGTWNLERNLLLKDLIYLRCGFFLERLLLTGEEPNAQENIS